MAKCRKEFANVHLACQLFTRPNRAASRSHLRKLEIPTAAQWLGELPALQCCKAWPGVSRGGTMPEDVPEVDEAKTRVFLKLQVIL